MNRKTTKDIETLIFNKEEEIESKAIDIESIADKIIEYQKKINVLLEEKSKKYTEIDILKKESELLGEEFIKQHEKHGR